MFLYHSKLTDPVQLEKMLFGRRETADWLEKIALLFAETGKATHSLLIGNRGMGKSHLMSVLYHRLTGATVVRQNVVIAYLEEDPYGIADYLDLLRRIIKAIARLEQNPDAQKRLHDANQILIGTEPKQRIFTAQRILLEHLAGRRMLLLVENLNLIFEALGEEGQSRWRDFLQTHDNTMICATAQAIFSDVQRRESPFFGFFHVTYLQKLQYQEARDLLLGMAETQQNTELIAYIDTPEGEAKLRAIFELTEGNHRLLVTFYAFFMAEFRAELSKSFLRTIDQMKPYYESFLKLLPPQQQKIVQFLVLERIPQTGRTIADNCFLAINALSKQMSELQRLGYVSSTRQGRDAYYEITEPMLRMCLESNENTDGILSIFVDFLGNLYPVQDLKFHFLRFHLLADIDPDPERRTKMADEAYLFGKAVRRYASLEPDTQKLLVLREASPQDQEQTIWRTVEDSEATTYKDEFYRLVDSKQYREAEALLNKAFPKRLSHYYWRYLAYLRHVEGRTEEAETAYLKVIEIKPAYALAWRNFGTLLQDTNRNKEAVDTFEKILETDPAEDFVWLALLTMYIEMNQRDEIENMVTLYLQQYSKDPLMKGIRLLSFDLLLWESGQNGIAIDRLGHKQIRKKGDMLLSGILLQVCMISKDFALTIFKSNHFDLFVKKCKINALPRALKTATWMLLSMDLSSIRLNDFHAALTEAFGHKTSMHYPLKFLHIGIRHVKEKDSKALLELTLEERRVFEREVLHLVNAGKEVVE